MVFPPKIINLIRFSIINHPIWVPLFLETPTLNCHKQKPSLACYQSFFQSDSSCFSPLFLGCAWMRPFVSNKKYDLVSHGPAEIIQKMRRRFTTWGVSQKLGEQHTRSQNFYSNFKVSKLGIPCIFPIKNYSRKRSTAKHLRTSEVSCSTSTRSL